MKRIVALAAALLALTGLLPQRAQADTKTPTVSAAGMALFEAESMRLIAADNAHQKAYMASTTKVMTALIVLETCDVDAVVKIPDEAIGMEGSSIYLARGETMSVRDLLHGLMLTSGNDAAVALAMHAAGSVQAFAERMNARAKEIGCQNTHFANPNGLPDEAHYTTAYDLGLIAATAMQNEAFCNIVGQTYHETATGDRPRTFKNKNKLLWQYEGGNGVKTGFTKAAGRCLVFSAKRNGMTLVGTLLNAPDMWKDAEALLDYGFETIENRLLLDCEAPLATIAVTGGEKMHLPVAAQHDILYPMLTDGSDAVSWEMVLPRQVAAPVSAGDAIGSVTLIINGEAADTAPLIATESIAYMGLSEYWKRIVERFIA